MLSKIVMKFLPLLGTIFTLSLASDPTGDSLTFAGWRALHEKSYESPSELQLRRAIFKVNAGIVRRHNQAFEQGWTSYAMTLSSPFADLSADEFASTYLMDGQNCSATHRSSGTLFRGDLQDLPIFVDWRTKGIVTPVKNQKRCGSCWTFSTTGTLEAHTCLHNAQPAGVDCTHWSGLAEQQLLDCASAYDNHGCNGGLPSHAYEYIKAAGGLDLEDSYRYRADSDGPCAMTEGGIGAYVAEVYNITSFDEDDLVAAIAQVGPVSIAYQVSPDFRFYSHGVYDSFNATTNRTMCQSGPMDVNHAVVAVGYGQTEATESTPSVPFYIVRNSWSTSFGMEGYFWMERGKNLCGVSDCASFPIVPAAATKSKLETPQRLRSVVLNEIVDEEIE
jgi:cathepsin H